jgi:TonB family protein
MNSPTPVNNAKSTNRTGENHKPGSLIATHQIIARKISHDSNNLKSLHAITGLIPQKDLRKPLAIKTNTAIQQTNSENKLTKTIPVSQNKQNQVAQQEMQRNFLLGEIKNRLLRFMYYPVQARKRGWEGKVMVSFHIDRNGFFHNIRLAHTSGYALLDSAALIAIRKVNNIPLSQRGKDFIPVAFQLPVIYRLSDS